MFSGSENDSNTYEAGELKYGGKFRPEFILILFKVLLFLIVDFFKTIVSFFVPSKPESLKNQLALVTGGGNGIGKVFCNRLAKEGCDIAVVDIDFKSAEITAKEIKEKFQVSCRAYKCDISDYSSIVALEKAIKSEMKPVDILVNNAGILYVASFVTSDVKQIQKTVDVNLASQILMVRTFLPSMVSQNYGKIISICSMSSIDSLPFGATYTATKYGVDGFMNALYDEFCVLGLENKIKLTSIYPDFVTTRKELSTVVQDTFKLKYDMLTPERVVDEAVDAIKLGKRRKIISDFTFAHVLVNKLPDQVRKYAKTSMGSMEDMKKIK